MKEKMNSIKIKAIKLYARTSGILADNRGEGYIGVCEKKSVNADLL